MIYMCSVILPPEGLVVIQQVILVELVITVELDIVTELDIVAAVVITVNMGTGDPIIRVVTERFATDPQLFPAVIITLYFVLGVNPLIVMLFCVLILSLALLPSSHQST